MRIDAGALRRQLQNLSSGIYDAATHTVGAATDAATKSARATTLFDDKSGKTRQSILGDVMLVGRVGLRGIVEAGGAARFLENGTVAHEIRAKGGGMLRFVMSGTVIYRRMVQHPGTAARPFMAQAKQAGIDVIDYAGEYFVGAAVQQFNAA